MNWGTLSVDRLLNILNKIMEQIVANKMLHENNSR